MPEDKGRYVPQMGEHDARHAEMAEKRDRLFISLLRRVISALSVIAVLREQFVQAVPDPGAQFFHASGHSGFCLRPGFLRKVGVVIHPAGRNDIPEYPLFECSVRFSPDARVHLLQMLW